MAGPCCLQPPLHEHRRLNGEPVVLRLGCEAEADVRPADEHVLGVEQCDRLATASRTTTTEYMGA